MRLCVGIAAFHPEAVTLNGNGIPVVHQAIDHVDHSREANGDAAFTSGVARCREEMRFAHPGWSDQHSRPMLFNELTIEQSDDFLLQDFLRKVKLIFGKGFQFWKLGLKDCSL